MTNHADDPAAATPQAERHLDDDAPVDGDDVPEESPGDEGHGVGAAGQPGTPGHPVGVQLEQANAAAAAAGMRPAPPKRTGVFLDPDDLRDHVGDLLRAMLGGYEVDAVGNYTFTHDTARIFITFGASPVGPTVGVFSITNVDVDFSEDLAGFLLTTNHKLAFGAFSYDPDNRAVWLKHTLLGTTLDGPELQAALMAVTNIAAQVDDAIREKFGGRAFHDAPEDVRQRTRPPEQDQSDDVTNASGYL